MQTHDDVKKWPLRAVVAKLSCAVPATFRVQQARGMFDLKSGMGKVSRFAVQVPAIPGFRKTGKGDEDGWRIGAIVGPSGSGKSTVARAAFGKEMYVAGEGGEGWPAKMSVLDGFGEELGIKAITGMLTAVGFSSPPAWLRPYGVLSNGEKFRCDLARALLGKSESGDSRSRGLVVFDEFTSVVDRTVAKVGSLAVAKSVRADRCGKGKRLVVVTCHYDILRWLQPDWVVDMATGKLARGALCRRKCGGDRPGVELEIRRVGREEGRRVWGTFARHHYLSGKLPPVTGCFVATWEGAAVGFCAMTQVVGYTGRRRVSRVVVLPDYQGIGIGGRLLDAAAEITAAEEGITRVGLVTSHPGMIASCARAGGGWKLVAVLRNGGTRDVGVRRGMQGSTGRAVARFRWVGGGSLVK